MGSEKGKNSVLEARTLKSGDGSREEGSYRLGNRQENGVRWMSRVCCSGKGHEGCCSDLWDSLVPEATWERTCWLRVCLPFRGDATILWPLIKICSYACCGNDMGN